MNPTDDVPTESNGGGGGYSLYSLIGAGGEMIAGEDAARDPARKASYGATFFSPKGKILLKNHSQNALGVQVHWQR